MHLIVGREGGTIISYVDRRWSNGDVYKSLGFTQLGKTAPGVSFFKGIMRFNRQTCQKKNLAIQFPEVYDKNKTSEQIMNKLNFNKIWDCGDLKFVKTI